MDIGENKAERLKQAYFSEKSSPELFPYETDLVKGLLSDIERQEKEIERVRAEGSSNLWKVNLYQMEVDRVKFILRSYLRSRLQKIEKHPFYTVQTIGIRRNLSEQEYTFAVGYVDALEKHFKGACLNRLPERLQGLDETTSEINMIPKPNLKGHVFIRILDDIGEFLPADGEETLLLEKDDIMVVPYDSFVSLVTDGRAEFV